MDKLLNDLINYGVNLDTINNRFIGDEDLFIECFKMFMEDEGFGQLGEALQKGNLTEAFNIAHNLKGVSGNLDLTPMFNQISLLVEVLRANKSNGVDELYENILNEKRKLESLLNDGK